VFHLQVDVQHLPGFNCSLWHYLAHWSPLQTEYEHAILVHPTGGCYISHCRKHFTALPCKTSAADTFDFDFGVYWRVQIQENKLYVRQSWGENKWCIVLCWLVATACHARDLWHGLYLPARQCCCTPSMWDNQPSWVRDTRFHSTTSVASNCSDRNSVDDRSWGEMQQRLYQTNVLYVDEMKQHMPHVLSGTWLGAKKCDQWCNKWLEQTYIHTMSYIHT